MRSLEEESDPIPTDHFFKIEEEATILSDPEYIYHKLIFDAVNEVLLNRINDGPTTTTRGDLDLESAKAEVKLRVGAMVKFGLRNFDAGQELEKIHELETEDEIKVFGELESFFRDTRQELVDGVLDHVLGDTVRVLGVLEMMETMELQYDMHYKPNSAMISSLMTSQRGLGSQALFLQLPK